MAGVRGCGSSVSEGIVVMGRLLMIPVTSAMNVTSSLCVSWELLSSVALCPIHVGLYRFGVPRHLQNVMHGED